MKPKQYLAITAIAFLFFLANLARPLMAGADSYAFINGVCGLTNWISDIPPLAFAFFSALPCDFFLFKFLLFSFMLLASFGVALLGSVFFKKRGWMAGLFVFMFPGWFLEFLKFENDFLAFPILMFANYFFFKGVVEKSFWNKVFGLVLVFFSLGFWNGAATYFFAFSFYSIASVLFSAVIVFVLGWEQLLSSLVPIWGKLGEEFLKIKMVFENLPGYGLTQWVFGSIGVLGVPRKLWAVTGFWMLFGLLNAKFAFHAIPFLAVGLVGLVNRALESGRKERVWGFEFNPIVFVVGVLFVATVVGGLLSVQEQPPQEFHFSVLEDGLELARSEDVLFWNHWGFGYWVEFIGGSPSGTGGTWTVVEWVADSVVVEQVRFFSDPRCELVRSVEDIGLWRCRKN